MPHSLTCHRPQQRGAALLVGLLMLVILSVLASSAMRDVSLQEKMVTASYDRLCATPDVNDTERWLDPNFTDWRTATVSLGALIAQAPRFIVEDMGTAPRWFGCDRMRPVSPYCLAPRYRITAVSGGGDRANVMLQVTYVPA